MPTTLITGASSGIGKALAWEFAHKGHGLILVARDEASLRHLESALRSQCHIDCFVIIKDLSEEQASSEVFAEVAASGRSVDVLVNNAGFTVHGAFLDTPLERELNLVALQVSGVIALTKYFLKAPSNQPKRILNVASIYAVCPVAHQAIYGAVKSFMLSFSLGLSRELKSQGIKITLLCPGSTKTNFRRRAGVKVSEQSEAGMDAARVAALGYQGLMAGKWIVVPGFLNKVFYVVCRVFSQKTCASLLARINRIRLSESH